MGREKIMKNIVCKFGGSSLANSKNIKLVSNIILSKHRNYVVVSAPGKRSKDDIKITDALIDCYKRAAESKPFNKPLSFVKARFAKIIKELDLNIELDPIFDEIYTHLISKPQ